MDKPPCGIYKPLSSACLTTGATVVTLIPRAKQYFDCNQTDSFFCPLLALQPQQQRAIFSRVMIVASLIICSQLAADFRDTCAGVNLIPQYTQALSLSRTSFSSQSGMFHLLVIQDLHIYGQPRDLLAIDSKQKTRKHQPPGFYFNNNYNDRITASPTLPQPFFPLAMGLGKS